MFVVDPCKEATVYQAWRIRTGKWLWDMFHDIQVKGASTHWLMDEILQVLKAYWDSLEFKVK